MLNLNEEENATQAIARMLRYGMPNPSGTQDPAEFDTGSSGDGGSGTEIEASAEETETEEA